MFEFDIKQCRCAYNDLFDRCLICRQDCKADRPEEPITLQEIDSLLRKRCAGARVLERAGKALEMRTILRERADEASVKLLTAVSRLGEVQFIEMTGMKTWFSSMMIALSIVRPQTLPIAQ